MPAKRIIILDDIPGPGIAFRYVLWADVPAARQGRYANANFVSAFENITPEELTALRAGQVTERVDSMRVQPNVTIGAVRTDLVAQWNAFQSEINAKNSWTRYGTFYDNAGAWNAGGVS